MIISTFHTNFCSTTKFFYTHNLELKKKKRLISQVEAKMVLDAAPQAALIPDEYEGLIMRV